METINASMGLILNNKNELLIQQRSEDRTYPLWWELPGGRQKESETSKQVLCRELEEEIGIKVLGSDHFLTIHKRIEEPAQNPFMLNLDFYHITDYSGTPFDKENQKME